VLMGIKDGGLKRLAIFLQSNESILNTSGTLKEMARLEIDLSVYWRIQPEGADLEHLSMDYSGGDLIEGVWAFESLWGLISDLIEDDSYVDQVANDGSPPEIVAIESDSVEDGSDNSVIITGGTVSNRFDAVLVLGELRKFQDEDGVVDEEALYQFLFEGG